MMELLSLSPATTEWQQRWIVLNGWHRAEDASDLFRGNCRKKESIINTQFQMSIGRRAALAYALDRCLDCGRGLLSTLVALTLLVS